MYKQKNEGKLDQRKVHEQGINDRDLLHNKIDQHQILKENECEI